MAAYLGSMSRDFTDGSKARLLSRKEYSQFGMFNESYRTTNNSQFGMFNESYRTTDNEDASLLSKTEEWWNDVRLFLVKVYEMGRSDPRQCIFAAKAGLALAIVSVLIFFKEPLDYISQYSIWAILTVILVFEFSVGATLSKGFNHALGGFSAGVLSLAIAELSMWVGDQCQEIVIFVSIFIGGSISGYIKLFPSMKPYEYGFRTFNLIFCIVLLSGNSHYDQTAVSRLLLVGVGEGVCLVVNICVFPIWAGEELHKLVVKNFRGVATSLEGCVNNYLLHFGYERIPSKILVYQASDDPLYSGYRSAVQSSSEEEALLGFAVWEPPHGRYKMLRYPWSHYVKVSGALRHCAFMVMAMHGCILAEIQAPAELRQIFKYEIQKVGQEGAKILRELGSKVEKMERLSPDIDVLEKVYEAAEELQMTIDQKSYHLVNTANTVKLPPVTQPKEVELDPEIVQEDEIKPSVIKSLSEANLTVKLNPKPPLPIKTLDRTRPPMVHWGSSVDVHKNQRHWRSRLSNYGDFNVKTSESKPNVFKYRSEANLNVKNPKPPLPIKTLNRISPNMSTQPSMVHWESSVDVPKNQMQWPSRLSVLGDTILNVREVKTYESASALSLATFTSSLIEFVARLQNLVSAFEELSEIAKFSEPVNPLEAKETVGFWTRVVKCIGIKD